MNKDKKMSSVKVFSFTDLATPNYQEAIKSYNMTSVKLAKTVAAFSTRIAAVYRQNAENLREVVEEFQQKNKEIHTERPGMTSGSFDAWEGLIAETENDAQSHREVADALEKAVSGPLVEMSTVKKLHAKKLYSHRREYDAFIQNQEEKLQKTYREYCASYQKVKYDAVKNAYGYFNSHNNYCLQIKATNSLIKNYQNTQLPSIMKEIEAAQIEIQKAINNGIHNFADIITQKATGQADRFRSIKTMAKQVNPSKDISSFVSSLNPEEKSKKIFQHNFQIPDPNKSHASESQEFLKGEPIVSLLTQDLVSVTFEQLKKDAANLHAQVDENDFVRSELEESLNQVDEGSIAFYSSQEDFCRRSHVIRLSNMELATVNAQLDALTPQMQSLNSDQDSKKSRSQALRGMWKTAFKMAKAKSRETEEGEAGAADTAAPEGKGGTPPRDGTTPEPEDKKGPKLYHITQKLLKKRASKIEEGGKDEDEIDPVYALLQSASETRDKARSKRSGAMPGDGSFDDSEEGSISGRRSATSEEAALAAEATPYDLGGATPRLPPGADSAVAPAAPQAPPRHSRAFAGPPPPQQQLSSQELPEPEATQLALPHRPERAPEPSTALNDDSPSGTPDKKKKFAFTFGRNKKKKSGQEEADTAAELEAAANAAIAVPATPVSAPASASMLEESPGPPGTEDPIFKLLSEGTDKRNVDRRLSRQKTLSDE